MTDAHLTPAELEKLAAGLEVIVDRLRMAAATPERAIRRRFVGVLVGNVVALAIACPHCNAEPGRPCVTSQTAHVSRRVSVVGGRVADRDAVAKAARRALAKAIGLIPIEVDG